MTTAKSDQTCLALFSKNALLIKFVMVFAFAYGTACVSGGGGGGGGGETAEQGAMFATNRACPSCHQSATMSDGILSGQTTVSPGSAGATKAYGKNITPDPATGIGNWTDEQLIRVMREGIDNEGKTICSLMPRTPDMTDSEARAIVLYMRSLPAVMRSIPDSVCP